jgi:hypothetical protein
MKKMTARKIGLFFLIGFMILLVCGCETINAFSSGSVRFDDVKTMTKTDKMAIPRTSITRPVYLSSADSEENPASCGWQSSDVGSEVFKTLKGTDSWIKNNLW